MPSKATFLVAQKMQLKLGYSQMQRASFQPYNSISHPIPGGHFNNAT